MGSSKYLKKEIKMHKINNFKTTIRQLIFVEQFEAKI